MLIISLTSFGERLHTSTSRACRTLLNQSYPADKVVLWVSREDYDHIPFEYRKLDGLEIRKRYNDHIHSHSKLIWSLQEYPNDIIVTADDDILYPEEWLRQLVEVHQENPHHLICHHWRQIQIDEPYISWPYNMSGKLILPLSGAGLLCPPHKFYKDVTDCQLINQLCPKADDLWFWAMAVLNQTPVITVPYGMQQVTYIPTTGYSLWQYNGLQGGNDRQLAALLNYYPILAKYVRN